LQPILEKRISTTEYNNEKATDEEFNEKTTEKKLNVEKLDEMNAEIEMNPEKNFKETAANEKHIELFNLKSQ
jgi:hypothetical protein